MGFWDGNGISWTICKQSAPCSRQITTPTPHRSIFSGRMLFLTSNQQCQNTEGILWKSSILRVCVYSDKEVCSSGRRTLLILRCDTTTTKTTTTTTMELSPQCAVGTCDGCNFVFMLRSLAVCPVCTASDFHTYRTTCIDGRRNTITDMITYVTLSVCLSVTLCVLFVLRVIFTRTGRHVLMDVGTPSLTWSRM